MALNFVKKSKSGAVTPETIIQHQATPATPEEQEAFAEQIKAHPPGPLVDLTQKLNVDAKVWAEEQGKHDDKFDADAQVPPWAEEIAKKIDAAKVIPVDELHQHFTPKQIEAGMKGLTDKMDKIAVDSVWTDEAPLKKPKKKKAAPNKKIVEVNIDQTVAPQPSPLTPAKLLGEVTAGLANMPDSIGQNIHEAILAQIAGVMGIPVPMVQPATASGTALDELMKVMAKGGPGVMELKPAYGMDGTVQMVPVPAPGGHVDIAVQVKPAEDQAKEVGYSTEEANSEVLDMVDEYTYIQAEINKHDMAPLIKRQDELKKKLQSIAKADHFEGNKPVLLYGTHGNYLKFSEKNNKTEISDKNGLILAVGQDTFNMMANLTLTDAKKLLSENELAQYTTTVEGSRTLKDVNLGDQ
jgi:hypothetical protein